MFCDFPVIISSIEQPLVVFSLASQGRRNEFSKEGGRFKCYFLKKLLLH